MSLPTDRFTVVTLGFSRCLRTVSSRIRSYNQSLLSHCAMVFIGYAMITVGITSVPASSSSRESGAVVFSLESRG